MRCTRQILSALTILLMALAPHVRAATGDGAVLHVGLDPEFAGTAAAPRIAISGTAPAGCVPKLGRVTLDGADLSIELSPPATACKQQKRVSFRLLADPVGATGLRTLPAEVYRVRVYTGSGTSTRLAAFALVDTSAPAMAPVPESGFWWTQAGADGMAATGTGMSLEFQENQLAASVLGFSVTGTPTWYFGSAPLHGRVARISLVQLANGEDWFSAVGAQPDVQPGPHVDIEFLSPTRAQAYLVRTDDEGNVQARSVVLSRSAFATGPAGTSWVGRWVLVPDDGANTRLYDFAAPSNHDAESFRLVDAASNVSLDCRLVAGTQQADVCTLSAAAGVIADFDQVGYDRFSGHGANGSPVQLLRVPR
ncbi:MAG TPA: hypothetical protein VGO25_00320 [Rhodanobacteraceae bacterium]|nr:hypothetical protein [Rhodanobacteraceae bacterium]